MTERIATPVSQGERTKYALHLALGSPVQCRAVIASSSYASSAFSFERPGPEPEVEWISCFKEHVRKVNLVPLLGAFSPGFRSQLPVLLSGPNLRSADLQNDSDLLEAVRGATLLLQELKVWELHEGRSEQLLMQTLAALSLRKLDLRCSTINTSACLFARLQTLEGSVHALSRCCPNLSDFGSIYGCGSKDKDFSFWTVWFSLPHIREVALHRAPPRWIIPKLQPLQSVTVVAGDLALRLTQSLGNAITRLLLDRFYVMKAKVSTLSVCVNMDEMHLRVDEGCESDL